MNHTLNGKEYKEFIRVTCLEEKEYDEEFDYLKDMCEEMHYWSKKVSGINHILCILLEQFEKKEIEGTKVLKFLYNLTEIADFQIQESELEFLDIILKDYTLNKYSFEDRLVIAQNRLYER